MLQLLLALAVAPSLQGVGWTEQAQVVFRGERVGASCALSGDALAVGAPDSMLRQGLAAVFAWNGSEWKLEAELAASDGAANDQFGYSLALEGDTLAIGAPDHWYAGVIRAGAVYVFERQGSGWVETSVLGPSGPSTAGDRFGSSVSLSGERLAVGAREADGGGVGAAGQVYVFARGGGGAWSETAVLSAAAPAQNDLLGTSVALRGDTLLAGAPGSSTTGVGLAIVFVDDGSTWSQQAVLSSPRGAPGDRFGSSVSLWDDRAAVGVPRVSTEVGGEARVFERSGTTWGPGLELTPSDSAPGDRFGRSVALFGESLAVGAPFGNASQSEGSVHYFLRGGATWREKAILSGTWAWDLGTSVVNAGTRVVAGAPDELVGNLSLGGSITGLAYDPATDRLYGVTDVGDLFYAVALWNGQSIGSIGFANVQALAFDSLKGVLYATDIATDQLLQVDPATAATAALGPLGFDQVRGLAFDPGSGTLYGTDVATDQLLAIDTDTGAGTAIGPLGKPGLQGLSYDPVAGVLYGLDRGSTLLVTVDPGSGATAEIGPTGLQLTSCLLFDSLRGHPVTESGGIRELDPVTAAPGWPWPLADDAGVAHVFALDVAETYCTAGTSASGCQAAISAAGSPSATATSGFQLLASGVEGGKDGLFFFGANGRQANPWGTGASYQCVIPPVKRSGLLPGAGTAAACDGSFAQDLNALWCPTCPKPLHNPGAGTLVQAQLWYRDPQNTGNQTTSLSDAVELLVGP